MSPAIGVVPVTVASGPMAVARAADSFESLAHALGACRALGQAVEADHDSPPAEGDEADAVGLARPPADGVAGGDVEVHAPRDGAIEHEAAVHLEEGKVRADEDGVVGAVLHVDLRGAPARVEGDRPLPEEDLAGGHQALRPEPPPTRWAARRAARACRRGRGTRS